MITIITARGISEQIGSNMVATVTRDLDPTKFRVRELEDYTAAYGWVGGNEAFGVSQAHGRTALLEMINKDPYPVILVGFSAGAQLVGDVALELALGKHLHLDVRAVGLIADPSRGNRQIQGPDRGGYGIKGSRLIPSSNGPLVQAGGFPVWSYSAPGDPISELPVGNPLRTLADLSEYWGPDTRRWMLELLARAKANQWQKWWSIDNWRTWAGAIGWADNYLTKQRHIRYAVEIMPGSNVTYTQDLRNKIIALEKKR